MLNYAKLFEWFRGCPELSELLTVAATENEGVNVIFPLGASEVRRINEYTNVNNEYVCEIIPYESVYEEFQINCYRAYDVRDETAPAQNVNVLTLSEVSRVCEWIKNKDEREEFPDADEQIVSMECVPFVPQIQYINPEEGTVGYFVTVRVRYVNRAKKREMTYAR